MAAMFASENKLHSALLHFPQSPLLYRALLSGLQPTKINAHSDTFQHLNVCRPIRIQEEAGQTGYKKLKKILGKYVIF